ncbi:hypothetical protein EZV73_05265 [Acidaminobacter sp. JC074]|uniref:hypothetical protein n=1 Tax=Acidaminobacter sp. JC074 TaxID=2530199 RepID=UPI001F0FC612|nr:hypothetical protein [Acidaminobacter sp. JC074]MCH4886965.1 hypothetical protein [Acidaminobacter sp. JC074]
MRILIAVMVIILGLVGFLFYNFVSDEVIEFETSGINTIVTEESNPITVDNLDDFNNYSHRVSTYEQTSENLVKATAHLIKDLDMNYLHIFYKDDVLTHEEFSGDTIDLGKIHKECLIVLDHQVTLESNLESDDFTFYEVDDYVLIHIVPKQTGIFKIAFDDVLITFENIERK